MGPDKGKRYFIKNFIRLTALAAFPVLMIRQKSQTKKANSDIIYNDNNNNIPDEDFFIINGWMVHINQVKSRSTGNI